MTGRAEPFRPGDVIMRTFARSVGRRCVVQDPPYTSRGKLRYKSDSATTVATAWWRTPRSLPSGFTYVGRES